MKSFFVLASFVAACFAQGIQIGAPLPNSNITVGSNFTVEVDRPESLTGSEEVAIIIGINECPQTAAGCNDPTFDIQNNIGIVLYEGPFNPQFDNSTPPDHKPPHQNFTVTAPGTSGEWYLSVSHLSIVAAGNVLFEIKNETLNLV
ncbi:hypothetical protein CERSUDRAFT_91348 [Gelatoporia subvermispora B]|uniref:Uncharacterized protein n=1 Tax=Ceriporiopsis subvermispora (strain B) TaxID=914234 RepID=M2RP29_CERS8|nr:hypothetical protein CERSUDRAFT_91348 [Gelatoporia subvermispora B]